jgi:hypothetical protein
VDQAADAEQGRQRSLDLRQDSAALADAGGEGGALGMAMTGNSLMGKPGFVPVEVFQVDAEGLSVGELARIFPWPKKSA